MTDEPLPYDSRVVELDADGTPVHVRLERAWHKGLEMEVEVLGLAAQSLSSGWTDLNLIAYRDPRNERIRMAHFSWFLATPPER